MTRVIVPAALAFLSLPAAALAQDLSSAAPVTGDPVPGDIRTLSYDMLGGPAGGFAPNFRDPAFDAMDEEGEPVDIFDFGTIAPAFATGAGGRAAFSLDLAEGASGRVRAFNLDRLTFGTRIEERRSSGIESADFGPNSFEETAAVEDGITAFANYDFLNDRTKRLGFDVSVARRRVGATAFTPEETASEIGASLSADLRLSSRLSFTGRAGVQLSDAAHGHLDATANKATLGRLSFSQAQGGLKDAYVQGGFSFALTENFAVEATMGYVRDLDTNDDAMMGRIGAAWKLKF